MTRSSKTTWIFALLFTGSAAQSLADNAHEGHDQGTGAAGEHWSAPPAAAKRRSPIPSDAASIEQGRTLFKQNCVTCHGPAGRGDGPAAASLKPQPADLATMAGHHPDGDLASKIANGRGAMPPWKGTLSEKQIWFLVNYLKSLPAAGGEQPGMQHRHH
jgi:mono/diheme cytochrome c family protein